MKKLLVKGIAPLLLAVISLALPSQSYADRKHGDVENIGNRSIGGKVWGILPNFVSLEKEIAIGQQVAQQFEQTARLQKSPRGEYELTDAVNGLLETHHKIAGLEIAGRWVDVRDPEVLAALERDCG